MITEINQEIYETTMAVFQSFWIKFKNQIINASEIWIDSSQLLSEIKLIFPEWELYYEEGSSDEDVLWMIYDELDSYKRDSENKKTIHSFVI